MSGLALVLSGLATAGVLLRGPKSSPGPNQLLLLAGFLAMGALVALEWRRRRLGRKVVVAVALPLLVLAVVVPPSESGDVWAYAMYGRMVARYHVSPYHHVAAEFPGDRFAARVDHPYRHTRSVYGPVFSGLSAVGMALAGGSALAARLFFQVMAALAVAAAAVVVDRRSRDPVAVALLAANPLTVVSVVNGAHNDALVGLGVLVGALLVGARRPVWAGVTLALALLVKVGAALPIVALGLWVWRRHGTRVAAAMAGAGAAVVLGGTLAAGGSAVVAALGPAQQRFSGGSLWWGPRRWLVNLVVERGHARRAAEHTVRRVGSTVAGVATLLLTVAVTGLGTRLRSMSPALVAGAAVLAYMLLGAYVLPWYLAWGLPVLALCWRSRLSWLALVHGAVLNLATVPDPRLRGRLARLVVVTPLQRLQLDLYQVWLPLLELTAVVALVVTQLRRSSATRKARSID